MFCESAWGLSWRGDSPGLLVPPPAFGGAHPKRIVLHPYSPLEQKNWPAKHFAQLAALLRDHGYDPLVLLTPEEAGRWKKTEGGHVPTAVSTDLGDVATLLYESGAVIGPDSGIGHLASAAGVPTLTIFRKRSQAAFWRPRWGVNQVVAAPVRLPGKRGHLLWKRFLTPARVLRAFSLLMTEAGRR